MTQKPPTKANDPNHEMHEAMADQAERGEFEPTGTPLRGEDAKQYLRELMGKPGAKRLGQPAQGRSPAWQVRLPNEIADQAAAFALASGLSKSDLMREAMAEYLATHTTTA
ncbi:MAG TPA: hypothetical protein DDY88_06815 [Actinobacteria bacterium]|nr:hypothetical protein [Actinomycetota bacterium]